MMRPAFLVLLAFLPQDPALAEKCEAFFPRLVSIDPEERGAAHAELARLAGGRREELKKAGTPAADLALAFLGEASVRKDVEKLLGDPKAETVRAAAEAAGFAGAEGAAEKLFRILEGEDLAAAMAAARSLGRSKSPPVLKHLETLAQRPEKLRLKVLAAYALELGGPGWLQFLLPQLDSADAAVREAAWAAFANLPSAADEIRKRNDEDLRKRIETVRKAFETLALPDAVRTPAARQLQRSGVHVTLQWVELAATPPSEVSAWARKALFDPKAYRKCVLVAGLIRELAKYEKAADPAQEPIPWLEETLRAEGAKGEGEKLADRLKSYREWWEKNRISIIDKDVAKAIDQGVAWLRERQREDGSWRFCLCGQDQPAHSPGTTALAVYTLLKCDVPLADKGVQSALEHLLTIPVERIEGGATYSIGLEAMAFGEACEMLAAAVKSEKNKAAKAQAAATHAKYFQRARECAEWLVQAQTKRNRGGFESGDWGYDRNGTGADNSNSQFAVLGLRAAQNAGVPVPERAWAKSLNHWTLDQVKDGGWPYRREAQNANQGGSFSMSAAGLYCWLVSKATLKRKDPATLAGEEPARKGLERFRRGYPVPEMSRTAAGGHVHSPYYDLYSLERAMMISRTEKLGDRDWYHDGALFILANQESPGNWLCATDTCFALLFLKRAFVPVATGDNK